ncbi:MAG: arginine deiminase-related protein [Bacteroidia bacterium]
MQQSTSTIFMIRPLHFGFNKQTAASNSFQKNVSKIKLLKKVQQQFDDVVKLLRDNDIEVFVFDDRADVITPDSIFPNNWISINNNTITLYPLLAENRRAERRNDIVDFFWYKMQGNKQLFEFTNFEDENKFVEGTGSMVLDHVNRWAYASISPRTHLSTFETWCREMNYVPVTFTAYNDGKPIYHTNVMMAIGTGYAVVAAETIKSRTERTHVKESLINTGHELILITNEQVNAFAGNMLEVSNKSGKKFLLMSETAYKSLSLSQIEKLKKHSEPLVCFIPAIEETGGGSIRCMIAEVFM